MYKNVRQKMKETDASRHMLFYVPDHIDLVVMTPDSCHLVFSFVKFIIVHFAYIAGY